MEMARKALVTAFYILALLLVSTPSLANLYGPGFGLNGLPCGWGPLSSSLGCAGGFTGPLCGSGVLAAGIPPVGCGTIPSCAIAGPSYAGSPGVYCSGFPAFAAGVPVPVPVPEIIPACAPACAPICAPAIAPACGPAMAPAFGGGLCK